MSRRRGLSLVEVLLVIGILVVVIGILLPALTQHRDRDGSRTTACNNLKQIVLAVHNYASTHGDKLPRLVDIGANAPTGAGLQSIFFELLSYVEQDSVYRIFDRSVPSTYYAPNSGAAQTIIKTYISPADRTAYGTTTNVSAQLPNAPPAPFAQSFTGTYATTSFAANGLIPWNTGTMDRTFVDGNSNTIMFAERSQVCDNGTTKTYNLWAYGLYGPSMPAFAVLTPDSPAGLPSTGQVAPAQTPPNGVTAFDAKGNTPNEVRVRVGMASAAEQRSYPYAFQIAPRAGQCDPAVPQTPHAGGMLVALADGSVRSISPTISQWTFWAACTPAGREQLYQDWMQ